MDIIDKALEHVARKFGKDIGDFKGQFICFPLPSLSTSVLFGYNGFPFGQLIHIYGEEGSLKTTTSLEIGRWIASLGGSVIYIDTEGRVNEDLCRLISGDLYPSFRLLSCDSMDEWIYTINTIIREKIEKPICVIVDSVFGANLSATRDSLFERGVLGHRYASEARELSDFLRSIRPKISSLPICWVMTNHMKIRTGPGYNNLIETCPGGNEVRYHSTVSLRLGKGSQNSSFGGRKIQYLHFRTTKNTYHSECSITVPVFYEEDRILYGWHTATTNILSSPKTEIKPEPKATLIKRINEIIPITVRHGGRKGDLFSCDRYGLVDLTAEEFGSKVMENEELKRELYRILGIREKYLYVPEKSWEENLDDFRRQSKEGISCSSESSTSSFGKE